MEVIIKETLLNGIIIQKREVLLKLVTDNLEIKKTDFFDSELFNLIIRLLNSNDNFLVFYSLETLIKHFKHLLYNTSDNKIKILIKLLLRNVTIPINDKTSFGYK